MEKAICFAPNILLLLLIVNSCPILFCNWQFRHSYDYLKSLRKKVSLDSNGKKLAAGSEKTSQNVNRIGNELETTHRVKAADQSWKTPVSE